jgi:ferredoxin-NADP reductase
VWLVSKVDESLQKFSPGQWVDLFIPGQPIVGGYSILSIQDDLPLLRLAVKNGKHPPTAWCFSDATAGDRVQVRVGGSFGVAFDAEEPLPQTSDLSPFGQPPALPSGTKRVVLIAGGIGINPLLAILQQFAHVLKESPMREDIPEEVVLLYGARSRAELAFEDDIRDLVQKFPKVPPDFMSELVLSFLACVLLMFRCSLAHPS